MKKIMVDIPLYPGILEIVVNCTEDEACKYFEKKYAITLDRSNYGGFHIPIQNDKTGHWVNLIYAKEFEWCIDDMCTMIHELLHATINILDRSGIPINKENQECITYLHDRLCGAVFLKLKPKSNI